MSGRLWIDVDEHHVHELETGASRRLLQLEDVDLGAFSPSSTTSMLRVGLHVRQNVVIAVGLGVVVAVDAFLIASATPPAARPWRFVMNEMSSRAKTFVGSAIASASEFPILRRGSPVLPRDGSRDELEDVLIDVELGQRDRGHAYWRDRKKADQLESCV